MTPTSTPRFSNGSTYSIPARAAELARAVGPDLDQQRHVVERQLAERTLRILAVDDDLALARAGRGRDGVQIGGASCATGDSVGKRLSNTATS